MAYWLDIYRFPGSIEYEYKYAGRYGAKGEKRGKRKKPTPEQIKKQNQRNRTKRMARLIKANFEEGDLWCTLKYPKGTRIPIEQVSRDLKNFIRALKYQFSKRGQPFKWIYRIEVGKRGGVHIHMVIGRIRGEPDTDQLIQEKWIHGRVNFQNLQKSETYADLAGYITKEPEEMEGQIALFPEEEQKKLIKYSCSRNLIRPKPERKSYQHWTMKRILEEGPKASEGYYIKKESVISGINPYTGMSYLRYEEYQIGGGG